jgi:hypothetical protein
MTSPEEDGNSGEAPNGESSAPAPSARQRVVRLRVPRGARVHIQQHGAPVGFSSPQVLRGNNSHAAANASADPAAAVVAAGEEGAAFQAFSPQSSVGQAAPPPAGSAHAHPSAFRVHRMRFPPLEEGEMGQPTGQPVIPAFLRTQFRVRLPPLQVRPLPDTQQQLRVVDPNQAVPICTLCCEYLTTTNVRACQNQPACTSRFCESCVGRLRAATTNRNNSSTTSLTSVPCPTCRTPTSEFGVDSGLADWLAQTPPQHCRYATCPVVLSLDALTAHEADCPCQRVACRYGTVGCPWQGWRGHGMPHETHECRFAPLDILIQRQRQTQATLEYHLGHMVVQLQASRQHELALEHRMRQLERRLVQQEVKVANLLQASSPLDPAAVAIAEAARIQRMNPRTLAQWIHFAVLVALEPRLLTERADLCRRLATQYHVVPVTVLGALTALDMLCTMPSRRFSTQAFCGLVLCTTSVWLRRRKAPDHVPSHWLTLQWFLILTWYHHTDQCLTLWIWTLLSTGCAAWLDPSSSLYEWMRPSFLPWLVIVFGIRVNLLLLVHELLSLVEVKIFGRLVVVIGNSYTLIFWLGNFLHLLTAILPGTTTRSGGALLGQISLMIMVHATETVNVWLAKRLQSCPSRWLGLSTAFLGLLWMALLIVDTLYEPLEALLEAGLRWVA